MPKSLADLLAETESVLDVRESQKQLKSGVLLPGDVEEMTPHTPWRDFLTETLLDPSQYLTGGVMGAGFAAKLGKPILATALRWADPLLGGSEAIGRKLGGETVGKWPIGARMGGGPTKAGRGREVSPQDLMGTPRREPAGLLETSPIELPPSSLPPSMGPPGTRTLGEMFPLGMRTRPGGLLPERASGRPMGEGTLIPEVVQEPRRFLTSGDVPGELSEDVVSLSNTFTRGFRQPIEELVEATNKVIGRNKLVKEAEKILGKKMEKFAETPSQARTHTSRLVEQTRLNEEFLKKPSTTETRFKVGDFVEFADKKGEVIKGKIRDIDELSGTAEVFTDRAIVESPDRRSEEVFLERLQTQTKQR